MAAKKTTRKTTRKKPTRRRTKPEPQTEIPRPETTQATAVQEAPDFTPELAELPLNVRSVDDVEPPPVDQDADKTDRELLERKPADRYEQGELMHLCGLPELMVQPMVGRKVIAEYLQTHDVTHQHLKGLEITGDERKLHAMYRPTPEATGLVDIMYFAAALRLWSKGMPIDPKKNLDLNSIKVGV